MKIRKYILLLVPFMVLLSSCEDLLDLYPEDRVTPTTFFKNESELELFTNNFYYNILPGGASIYADEADIIINPLLNDAVSGQRIIPETSGGVGGWGWTALRQINYFLEYHHQCEDEEVRNHYEGIARFFRAYFYFYKVQRYGDVPWYDHVIGSADTEDLNKARDSRDIVVKKMIEDLDWAYEHMRNEKSVYRVTKWTCLALKSRICLFEGTFQKYHNVQGGDWQYYLNECVEASDLLMKNSGYSIWKGTATPYRDLFKMEDADGTEMILARDYSRALNIVQNAQAFNISTGAGCSGATRRLAWAYLMKDGTSFTDKAGHETMQFLEESQNRDPRFAQTLRCKDCVITDADKAPNVSVAKLGYQLLKYHVDGKSDMNGANDLPLFRYAEILLNFAEAKAELGTLTQTDLDASVNKLRDRVGMPYLTLTKANNSPDSWLEDCYPNVDKGANKGVILEIRRERTVELVAEGFRYYDIMRWKEGKQFERPFLGMYFPAPGEYDLDGDGKYDVCLHNGDAGNSSAPVSLKLNEQVYLSEGNSGYLIQHKDLVRNWNEDRDYLYPIPTKDRILTGGALSQNPGWTDGLQF